MNTLEKFSYSLTAVTEIMNNETIQKSNQTLSDCLSYILPMIAGGKETVENLTAALRCYLQKKELLAIDDVISPKPELGVKILHQMAYNNHPTRQTHLAEILKKTTSKNEQLLVYPNLISIYDSLLIEEIEYLKRVFNSDSQTIPFVRAYYQNTNCYISSEYEILLKTFPNELSPAVVLANLTKLGLLIQKDTPITRGGVWRADEESIYQNFETEIQSDQSRRLNICEQITDKEISERLMNGQCQFHRGYYKTTTLAGSFFEMIESR